MFGIPFEISKGPAGGKWEMSKGAAGGQWECKPREEYGSLFESSKRGKSAAQGSLEEMLGGLFPKSNKERW